jgi:hypothetical protein
MFKMFSRRGHDSDRYDRFLLKGALIIIGLALVTWLGSPHQSHEKNRTRAGEVRSPGEVRRYAPKGKVWTEVKNGATYPGDFLSTDDSHGAELRLEGDRTVTLSPSTVIELVPLGEGKLEIVLHQGQISSTPGVNVRQSDRFDTAKVPVSRPQWAMPIVPVPSTGDDAP